MMSAALALIPILLLPVVVHLERQATRALDIAGLAIWAAFAAEYATLLYLAPRRRVFVRSHIPDLVLIAIPVFRPLRALRVLRLLSVGSALAAIVHAAQRSRAARGVGYTLAVVTALLVSLAFVVLDLERDAPNSTIRTTGDALWWAISTATTVGYGDRYPVTTAGRLVAVVVMLSGIGLIGVVTAAIAAWFVRNDVDDATVADVDAVGSALEAMRAELAALRAELLEARPSA
jgi:voltage-gated potassium channel